MIDTLIGVFNGYFNYIPKERMRIFIIRVLVAQKMGWKVGIFDLTMSRKFQISWGADNTPEDYWVGRKVMISPQGELFWFPSFDGDDTDEWVWMKAAQCNILPSCQTLDSLFPIIGNYNTEVIFSLPTPQQAIDRVLMQYLGHERWDEIQKIPQ